MQRTRLDRVIGSRSWTSLMTTARTLSWSFMRLAPGLGVSGAGGS